VPAELRVSVAILHRTFFLSWQIQTTDTDYTKRQLASLPNTVNAANTLGELLSGKSLVVR
jgi:hypothetical protein